MSAIRASLTEAWGSTPRYLLWGPGLTSGDKSQKSMRATLWLRPSGVFNSKNEEHLTPRHSPITFQVSTPRAWFLQALVWCAVILSFVHHSNSRCSKSVLQFHFSNISKNSFSVCSAFYYMLERSSALEFLMSRAANENSLFLKHFSWI